MTSVRRPLFAVGALFGLAGCAGTGASLDRLAEQVEARSNCHTSTGEYVPSPGCIVSYSVSSIKTTETTTTTTTTAADGTVTTTSTTRTVDDADPT